MEWLKSEFNQVETQFKQEWCKNRTYLPFDFCLKDLKIIIELDGAQHFTQVSNWRTPEDQQERDLYKQNCALEQGYSIVRILQTDVYADIYDWRSELRTTITNLRGVDEVNVVYMCKNNEYDSFCVPIQSSAS